MKPIIAGSLVALSALSLTANALMYLRYSSSRPLVTVGGQVISKKDYQDALDAQTHGAVLRKMVVDALIEQAAAQAGVTPGPADVDARIADIQRRAPQQLPVDDPDGSKMAAFRRDVLDDLALENLRLRGVTVNDADVSSYYEANKAAFTVPVQVQTAMVVTDNTVDATEAASLLRQNIGLDVIARQPRLHVAGTDGFQINWKSLPQSLNRKISGMVFGMKKGDVEIIPAGSQYIVLQVTRDDRSGVPSLEQIRPEVRRLAALGKAVSADAEIALLYKHAKPAFAVAKYESYFTDLSSSDASGSVRASRTADLP